ncbi:hypothetical protein PH210_13185 [Paenibacillus sp. BSR1-1]|uniref:hypothetical protein n=1 Tax=Paenibacillus sp. BSR1-1 TaxID=3020845 RepID=UPI0025AEFA47|nr:hypothetical protein [Paenibacillus sp. BSR1-1]MDN3017147.1 hypothetical protein [Paenibacillus sp. BSR1-1]
MAYFLKGNQILFVFDKIDNEKLLSLIFEKDLVLYKNQVDFVSQQIPIENMDNIDNNYPYYWIVPKAEIPLVKWETVKLVKGGETFPLDNLNSRAVQLILPTQSPNIIGTGRIAITTEWEDDEGNIQQASFEKDVYKILQSILRKLSVGKIGGLFVGKNAYSLWEDNQVELCYDTYGNLCYSKDRFKYIRKKK